MNADVRTKLIKNFVSLKLGGSMCILKNFLKKANLKKFTILFVINCLVLINPFLIYAGCDNPDPCPGEGSWTSVINQNIDNGNINNYGGDAETMDITASWQWKLCPDGTIVIRNITATTTNITFWTSHSDYQYDFSGFQEYTELQILNYMISRGLIDMPNCCPPLNNCGFPFVKFYTARCGVWVRCSYEFACQPIIHHPRGPGGDISCPQPWNNNGNTIVDVWQWQPCGDVCCEKTYTICLDASNTQEYVVEINNVARHPYNGQMCTQEGQFFDWFTGQPYQCQDGCAGDGNP